MRSFLILGVALLLTIAAPFIVQAEEICGNLGSGSNACKCGETVVKAAKVQKPTFYASPEAINEAATAREAVGRLSIGTNQWQAKSIAPFPKYNPYASRTFSSSSSSSSSGSNSFSSSSTLSSVGLVGGLIGAGKAYSPFKSVSGRVTSNCGKTSESLQVRDLLSSNVEGKVVPSFPPIGDLCYPSPHSNKYQVTTKVTPAYPGKIKCVPPIPYEVCVQVLNGQINEAGLRKLGLVTDGKLGEYISNNEAKIAGQGGFSNFGGYKSYGAGSSASSTVGSSAYGGYGSYAGSGASSTAYGYSGLAGYGSHAGAGASLSAIDSSSRSASNVETIRGSAARQRSSCESINNFGDDSEFPEDYSYPRLPADPVSVTLAYKNLFPRTVYYNRRAFIPEDKLAFGHRTVPTELIPGKKVLDVPEEKLQILDKPVVELKPVSPVPVAVGVYDEHEEAKLAELEAIERERINQEEIAERQQNNLITYGDLGYAPINRVTTGKSLAAGPIGVYNTDHAEDDTGTDCGPVGPPDPDYIPGSVVIDRELVENKGEIEVDSSKNIDGSKLYIRHYTGDQVSDEEDDSDDSTSGIFARLKSVARKYGPSCNAPV